MYEAISKVCIAHDHNKSWCKCGFHENVIYRHDILDYKRESFEEKYNKENSIYKCAQI